VTNQKEQERGEVERQRTKEARRACDRSLSIASREKNGRKSCRIDVRYRAYHLISLSLSFSLSQQLPPLATLVSTPNSILSAQKKQKFCASSTHQLGIDAPRFVAFPIALLACFALLCFALRCLALLAVL
jgi:hypothetical protein